MSGRANAARLASRLKMFCRFLICGREVQNFRPQSGVPRDPLRQFSFQVSLGASPLPCIRVYHIPNLTEFGSCLCACVYVEGEGGVEIDAPLCLLRSELIKTPASWWSARGL